MKTRKNKKVYNFTDKQRRRDRSLKHVTFYSIGKHLKTHENKTDRKKVKHTLYLIVNVGLENIEIPHWKKTLWWDC